MTDSSKVPPGSLPVDQQTKPVNKIIRSLNNVNNISDLPPKFPNTYKLNDNLYLGLPTLENRFVSIKPYSNVRFTRNVRSCKLRLNNTSSLDNFLKGVLVFKATTSHSNPTALVSPIYTLTVATEPTAGNAFIFYKNPVTKQISSIRVAFNTSAADIKAALEAMPSWIPGAVATANSTLGAGTTTTITIDLSATDPIYQQTLHTLDNLWAVADGLIASTTLQYIATTISTPQVAPSFCVFSNNMVTMIDQLKLKIGGFTPLDEREKSLHLKLKENLVRNELPDPENNSIDYLYGCGDLYKRIEWSSGRYYAIHLDFNILTQDESKMFLSRIFKNQIIELEIMFRDAEVLEASSGTTNHDFEIEDVELIYEEIYDPNINNLVDNESALNNSYFKFNTYTHQVFPITSQISHLNIENRLHSVNSIKIFMTSQTNSINTLNKFDTYLGDIRSLQVRLGSLRIPIDKFDSDNINDVLLYHILKNTENYSFNGKYSKHYIGENFANGKSIIHIDLQKHNQYDLIDGANTISGSSPLVIDLELSALPSDRYCHVFLEHTKILKVDARTKQCTIIE